MYKWTLFILLTKAFLFGSSLNLSLTDDFQKGKEVAQAYLKPMILIFVGSDWSKDSEKFISSILEDSEFREAVKNHFVLVKIDFPEINVQPSKILTQNKKLKNQFNIRSYPTIILLDQHQMEVTRMGYLNVDGRRYADHVKEAYFEYQKLLAGMHENRANYELLYQKAKSLNSPCLIEKLLRLGLEKEKGVFFHLEKYRSLIGTGDGKSNEAKSLRSEILKRDPKNSEGAHRALAILDFQEREKAHLDPQKIVEPLMSYVEKFGIQDKNKDAFIEILISEYMTDSLELSPRLETSMK